MWRSLLTPHTGVYSLQREVVMDAWTSFQKQKPEHGSEVEVLHNATIKTYVYDGVNELGKVCLATIGSGSYVFTPPNLSAWRLN